MPRLGQTKLTAETRKQILDLLRAGNTRLCAAQASGISKQSFYTYQERDAAFAFEVIQAESEAEAGHVIVLAKAASAGDWRASESWLKRRRRDDWGDYVVIKNFDPAKLTDEELENAHKTGKVVLEMTG